MTITLIVMFIIISIMITTVTSVITVIKMIMIMMMLTGSGPSRSRLYHSPGICPKCMMISEKCVKVEEHVGKLRRYSSIWEEIHGEKT